MNQEKKQWDPEIDGLTGLYNRLAFYKYAKELIDDKPEDGYMLIMSDIESFKMINMRYGEQKGDELLAYVGKALSVFNDGNSVFARYSGDQFVGLIRHNENHTAEDLDPMMKGMDIMYKNAPIDHFETKFGIYDNVEKDLPISIMCDRALMALRTIKHQYGKYVALYDQRMRQQFMKEQSIQESMEQALVEKQFVVYYQPKHSAATGELVGAEALVRWIHPAYGFMSPAEFLPVFEKNGFISNVDRYVYNTVIEDLKRWQNKGLKVVPVSVNASRKDILKDNFISEVLGGIKDDKDLANLLHMEITESVFIEDVEILKPIIIQLRESGIKIELDDFGSGFSALSMLTTLPLDVIKLDKSFIDNLELQRIVVDSVIKMCHGLGFELTAEGVETADQLSELVSMGCDNIQGYYFAKPMQAGGFEEYIKSYQ